MPPTPTHVEEAEKQVDEFEKVLNISIDCCDKRGICLGHRKILVDLFRKGISHAESEAVGRVMKMAVETLKNTIHERQWDGDPDDAHKDCLNSLLALAEEMKVEV